MRAIILQVPGQAGACKNLHTVVSWCGLWRTRSGHMVTGDVVTSEVDFVDEGGKNTACATKDGYR